MCWRNIRHGDRANLARQAAGTPSASTAWAAGVIPFEASAPSGPTSSGAAESGTAAVLALGGSAPAFPVFAASAASIPRSRRLRRRSFSQQDPLKTKTMNKRMTCVPCAHAQATATGCCNRLLLSLVFVPGFDVRFPGQRESVRQTGRPNSPNAPELPLSVTLTT